MADGFVFYRSFYEALKELPDDLRVEAYDAICKYALTGEAPDGSGTVMAIFKLVKPQVDANNKRRESGRKGATATWQRDSNEMATGWQTDGKPIATEKQPDSTPIAKVKVKVKDKVKDKEKEVKEKEKEKLSPEVKKELDQFIEHRKKLKKPMTDHAVDLLIVKLNALASTDEEKIALLREAIEKGWQSVYKHDDRGKPQNRFNRFDQREYKEDDLERDLLFGG